MRVAFSDRLRTMLSDPEAERQLQSWMVTGKPEFITICQDGNEITVRAKYVPLLSGQKLSAPGHKIQFQD